MMLRRNLARTPRILRSNLVAGVLLTLCFLQSGEAQRPASARTALPKRPTAQSFAVWRDYLASAPPSRAGCFTTSYPSTRWRQVPCRRGPTYPEDVGGGSGDFVANDTPLLIQDRNGITIPVFHPIRFVEGTFPTVTGVQTVTDSKTSLSGDYSLQINTNRFAARLCDKATPPGCQGWQQFVYTSDSGMVHPGTGTSGQLFIQYWLLNFGPACLAGWQHPDSNPNDCYKNGPNQLLPDGFPITQLANFFMIASSGERDTLIFINSTYNFVYAIANDPNILGLGPNWRAAEFNVFGLKKSSQAKFNDGSSIVVSLSLDHGALAAPECGAGVSFTGETNNLNLTTTPSWQAGPLPRIEFTETKSAPTPASCGTSDGNGNGLHVVYRWVHPGAGAHFYTQDPSGELAPETGYVYEGAPFSLLPQFLPGTTEFFRFRCPNGHHYYTTDAAGELGAGTCQREASLGFIATSQLPGTTQLFRWYNPGADDHFYTTDPNGELAPSSGYHQETSPGFVKPGPGF
jgi:hypothetical protein